MVVLRRTTSCGCRAKYSVTWLFGVPCSFFFEFVCIHKKKTLRLRCFIQAFHLLPKRHWHLCFAFTLQLFALHTQLARSSPHLHSRSRLPIGYFVFTLCVSFSVLFGKRKFHFTLSIYGISRPSCLTYLCFQQQAKSWANMITKLRRKTRRTKLSAAE